MTDQPIHILLVEDDPDDAFFTKKALQEMTSVPIELTHVDSLNDGLNRLAKGGVDVVLLDLSLPDTSGMETIRRARSGTQDVPIVVLTGFENEAFGIEALREGAQDYFLKSRVQGNVLHRSIRYAIERHRLVTERTRAEEAVRLLLSLTQAINESQDFNSALAVSLRKICEATGWILGQAWVPSIDGKFLLCGPSWHQTTPGLDKLRAIALETRWKLGEGLAGSVWSTRKPLWVTDVSEDPPVPFAYRAANAGIEAFLGIPVIAGDEVVSVLEFCVAVPQTEDNRRMAVVSAVAVQLGTLFLRKRSDEALRESEERYRTLIETATDVIFRLTPDGKFVGLNRAFETTTGWSREEWLGREFASLLHPEDKSVALGHIEALLRGDLPGHHSYRIRKKTGEYVVGEFTISVELQDGLAIGLSGIARDVTERNRAEEALRESEERFRRMVETAEEGIWVLDRSYRTVFVNRKMAETLGYSVDEMTGRLFEEFLVEEDKLVLKGNLERSGPCAKLHQDVRFLSKEGAETWALLAWSPVVDPKGSCTGALAMVSDITERKRAEEAVHQSEEHYRELFHQAYHMQESLRHLSNRILEVQEQERTRISRELHDEVGQALTAISVNLAVLKREVPTDNHRFLKKIADSQALLSQSMEAVHGFARELRPALLDDLGLLAAMRSYINAFVERTGIRVQFRAPAAEAVEAMDIAHKAVIYRVAQESLNNIAKHAEAKRVNFTIRRVQQRISIEIHDDGKGFDLEQRPPGKTPDRLGLLGMQERVRLINGEFSIDSQPGHGTLVRVQIPSKPQ